MKRLFLRSAVAACAALTTVFGVGSATPSLASSGWKWTSNGDYGYQAEELLGNGTTLDTINMRFIPPNRDYFTNTAWRFHITTYSCDPRGKDRTAAGCKQNSLTFNGPLRTGNPPKGGSTCTTLGIDGTGVEYCEDFGLAWGSTNSKTFSNWTAGKSYPSGTWFCTEIQTNSKKNGSGTWSNNGTSNNKEKGLRACAEVHS